MASGKKETTAAVDKAIETIEQPLTILLEHLPAWMKDSQYIKTGYRPPSGSYYKSFTSIGYLHNESVNIWSHLLGAIGFALAGAFLWTVLSPRYAAVSKDDVYVFACFFLSAIACLGMSATYHTLCNHSDRVAVFANQLDYLGIVLLIWGSFIPSIYYGFSCEPNIRKTYWTMITTVGAGCAVVAVNPKFRRAQYKAFGASMFVAMGLTAVFPVFHGWLRYGLPHMVEAIGLPWLVSQGVLYIIGAAIYAVRYTTPRSPLRSHNIADLQKPQTRIPEKWYPGDFDIWGSSHQIFHVLVVAAACVHLIGLLKAFDFYHSHPGSRCPSPIM